MGEIVSFPVHLAQAFQTVKAQYSCREIRELFGLSERTLRRWAQQGIVRPFDEQTMSFDFTSLPLFRKARELRAEGYSAQRIETEISSLRRQWSLQFVGVLCDTLQSAGSDIGLSPAVAARSAALHRFAA